MHDSDRLTLRQIRYFTAIADQGSLRQAADRLGVTQPTLTAQIAALEKALGTTLFERSRSGTTLSSAGRELLPSARRVQEEVRGFWDQSISLSSGVAGTYRLGVTPTLGPYLLPSILPAIHARFVDLKLYVREAAPSDLEEDLKSAQHDLILSTQPLLSRDLVVEPLFREPLKLALAKEHPLASASQIRRRDLEGENVLTIDEHHLFHRQIADLCARLGANLLRDYEGTSLDTLRQMVVMGMGIAFLPALYVRSEIRDRKELKIVNVKGVSVFRSHVLAWRPQSPARNLFKQLAQQIREIAGKSLARDVTLER